MKTPLRVGIGGPVGSGKTALTLALCKRCATASTSPSSPTTSTPRRTRSSWSATSALARRAHHRRRDRRLPAHRDPRRRLDQPRGGRRA